MRSSTSSMPIERRSKLSVIPSSSLIFLSIEAWVIIAGCSIKLSTPPKLSANVNKLRDFKNLLIRQESNVVIDRGAGWIVPLGAYSKLKTDCKIPLDRKEGERVLIYCGEGKGEILLK